VEFLKVGFSRVRRLTDHRTSEVNIKYFHRENLCENKMRENDNNGHLQQAGFTAYEYVSESPSLLFFLIAHGPYSHMFSGVYEQNDIPHLMAFVSCIGNGLKTCDLNKIGI
jgi:hypothetical protein